jgi:hypothetical protein
MCSPSELFTSMCSLIFEALIMVIASYPLIPCDEVPAFGQRPWPRLRSLGLEHAPNGHDMGMIRNRSVLPSECPLTRHGIDLQVKSRERVRDQQRKLD